MEQTVPVMWSLYEPNANKRVIVLCLNKRFLDIAVIFESLMFKSSISSDRAYLVRFCSVIQPYPAPILWIGLIFCCASNVVWFLVVQQRFLCFLNITCLGSYELISFFVCFVFCMCFRLEQDSLCIIYTESICQIVKWQQYYNDFCSLCVISLISFYCRVGQDVENDEPFLPVLEL